MKLMSTALLLASAGLIAGCNQSSPETANSKSALSTDANGMGTATGTASGTTEGAQAQAPAQTTLKQSSSTLTKKKMDATRPGTEHDLTGGNESESSGPQSK